ncbi:MAG TPA: glucose 1-dehydrogenase [Cyclobacteriaceae bacterium]|nr:glucose 1-dehydrogenase [Cyclobacteriaceae bacterium]HRJ81248.1 glucose 1-dehydrogenase [Cyclobacteriaceae bacterium]
MKTLENKVAIITGAGSGIGEATAKLFASEGAKVVVSDISEQSGKRVVEEIKKAGGEAIFVKADTGKAVDHENLVKETVKAFGKLNIAVNNAGIGGPSVPTGEYPIDGWQKVIDINLSGVFYGLRYQLPEMVKAGSGSVVNIASILGQAGFENSVAYVASKHGVVGLTKTAGIDYAKKNIRVNAIGPGFIYTGLVNEETMGKEGISLLEQKHPIGRLGKAQEVAELALFLASDKASFITASYYPVDGGYLAV